MNSIRRYFSLVPLSVFWRKHPALLLGSFLLATTAYYHTGHTIFFFPLSLALYPICGWRLGSVILCFLFFLFQIVPHPAPEITDRVLRGTFYPTSIKEKKTPFGPKWEYQGKLALESNQSLPVKLSLPLRPFFPRPSADQKYSLEGVLKEGARGPCFVPLKASRWIPVEPLVFGLAECRYQAKKALKNQIVTRFSSEKAARFLEGVSTGEFQDRMMSREFSRFGLQHIMAVSGFHFAVMTGILCQLFFAVLGRRWGAFLLIGALLLYFLFLGGSPSVTRAWVSATLAAVASLLNYSNKSLNLLGIGLCVVIMGDPTAIFQPGFQFSFAITASILLWTPIFEQKLALLFPSRAAQVVFRMPGWERAAYVLLQWIKKGWALSLAVNFCAIPMTLYFFGKFPVWSLYFNLFFPLMVAFAIFLLILGLTAGVFLESVGFTPSLLSNWYTDFMLNLAYNFPRNWDFYWESNSWTETSIVLYLTMLFLWGIVEGKSVDRSGVPYFF